MSESRDLPLNDSDFRDLTESHLCLTVAQTCRKCTISFHSPMVASALQKRQYFMWRRWATGQINNCHRCAPIQAPHKISIYFRKNCLTAFWRECFDCERNLVPRMRTKDILEDVVHICSIPLRKTIVGYEQPSYVNCCASHLTAMVL
jgi:hypothetical protein